MGWYNSDSLYVKFGKEEATPGKVATYRTAGPVQVAEIFLDETALLALSATAGATILDYNTVIPKNARIEKVEVITQKATTSGGAAVLNIGLVRTDTTTELDFDGLVAAIPKGSTDAAGETTALTVGATYAGALIGTVLANNGYVVADYDTAAYTAGELRIRVHYVRDVA